MDASRYRHGHECSACGREFLCDSLMCQPYFYKRCDECNARNYWPDAVEWNAAQDGGGEAVKEVNL